MSDPFELATEDVLGVPMTVFAHRKRSLGELLDASREYGDRDYLVDGDRRISYAEHHAAVTHVAEWLMQQGVGKGDRVAILGRNSIEWVVTFWATVSLGAIAVGLNAWWSAEELQHALDDCTPTLVIDDMAPIAERVVSARGQGPREHGLTSPQVREDDPAVILYTSGTTGRAKGATHSHRNLLCLVQAQQHLTVQRLAAYGLPADFVPPQTRTLTSTPLFHVSGLHSGVVACLGAGNATMWQPGRFDVIKTLQTIEREQCTAWTTMPTTLWRVVNEPRAADYDLSSMRHIGGGGAAWSHALQRQIAEVFGDQVTWGIGYGLTECTGLATTSSFADLQRHPDNVGRPVATVEVEIRDPDGRPTPEGESGEIYIRGPMVMLGYWNNPAATEAVIDGRRWLRSGDLGEIRDELLFLSSRRTDLILRGAENVYPAEIENCLEGHPLVSEVAVIGVPDDEFGQQVAAVVVPHSGQRLDEADLAGYVKARLAYFKVPSYWYFRDDPLPRTATGKVIRAAVIDTVVPDSPSKR